MTGAVQRTDREEWRIVDELYPSLRRFAAVTAPWDMEPDDLLQDALVNVLRKHSLSELDYPAAYLRRTMINLATSHSRHMGTRRRKLPLMGAAADSASVAEYPSDLAELLRLPPRERAALYLAEVEGYHFDEIARMLDCSEAAARKRASRARKHLKLQLTMEGRQ